MKKPKWWRKTDLSNPDDVLTLIITDFMVIIAMILIIFGWIIAYGMGIQLILPVFGIFAATFQMIFVIYKYKKSRLNEKDE